MPGGKPFIAQYELPGFSVLHVDHEGALEVPGQDIVDLVDDDEHLSGVGVFEVDGGEFLRPDRRVGHAPG